MRAFTIAIVSASVCLAATAAYGAETYKITRCPPNKPYCIQEVKPALTAAEIAEYEARPSTVRVDLSDEARKAEARSRGNYRDPGASAWCPPPRRMTARDGCQ